MGTGKRQTVGRFREDGSVLKTGMCAKLCTFSKIYQLHIQNGKFYSI